MIIKNISSQTNKIFTTVSADIKTDQTSEYDHIFFRIRNKSKFEVAVDGTAFVALTLLIAMWLDEDIVVESTVSRKFYNNLQQIMNLLTSWNANFKKIKIIHDGLKSDSKPKKGSSCFFSLGVDSFYTYIKHSKSKEPIKNLIFVHGFDIALENHSFYKETLQKLDGLAKSENIDIFSVQTNLRQFTEKHLEWDWEHGGAMASIAFLLRQNYEKTYFAGSDSSTQRGRIIPYGTHPLLDPLWKTEHFNVIHDGDEFTRLQKIQKLVSRSELALTYLRVCNQNLRGKYNCSQCEKCIRTMVDLKISEALDKAKTFTNTIPLNKLTKINNSHFETKIYFEDSLSELIKLNKYPDLQSALEKSLEKSSRPSKIDTIIKYLSALDKKHNNGRINNFIFGTTQNGDRKVIFKILASQSLIR